MSDLGRLLRYNGVTTCCPGRGRHPAGDLAVPCLERLWVTDCQHGRKAPVTRGAVHLDLTVAAAVLEGGRGTDPHAEPNWMASAPAPRSSSMTSSRSSALSPCFGSVIMIVHAGAGRWRPYPAARPRACSLLLRLLQRDGCRGRPLAVQLLDSVVCSAAICWRSRSSRESWSSRMRIKSSSRAPAEAVGG